VRDADMIAHAKQFRRDLTPAEARLWYHLRAKRFGGFKFRKQTPIGRAIGDFTCRAAMLVVEVDGDTHATQAAYDARRTRTLEAQGWRVIRFTNAEVMGNIDGVLATIRSALPPRDWV